MACLQGSRLPVIRVGCMYSECSHASTCVLPLHQIETSAMLPMRGLVSPGLGKPLMGSLHATALETSAAELSFTDSTNTPSAQARQQQFTRVAAYIMICRRSSAGKRQVTAHTARDGGLVMSGLVVVGQDRPSRGTITGDGQIGLILSTQRQVTVAQVLVVPAISNSASQ